MTQELLFKLFDYNDGELIWKIRPKQSRIIIGESAGHFHKTNRFIIKINGKQYLRSRLIFLFHYGWLPDMVDHEDRDTLNDRIGNLRAADKYKNQRNTTSRKGSSSKYLGVCLRKQKYWNAAIFVNGKRNWLGSFKNEQLAALAYNRAAVMHHKEFANLNIITI